jgi:hypothetical protein
VEIRKALRNSLRTTAIGFALALCPALLACGELPDTSAPLPKSRGGDGGSGGSAVAGSTGKGGTSSGKSGASGDGGSSNPNAGTDGSGGSGASGGSGGSSASGGTSGSGGSGAEGGEADAGTGGTNNAGTNNGGGGNAGKGGSAGGSGAGSGGGGGKAGSGGAGSGGAGSGGSGSVDDFFGDSRCTSDFTFCEDFEGGALDTDIWEPSTSGGPEPAVDDTRAARGDGALHVTTEDYGFAFVTVREPFPMADNTYYARMFVYFTALPTEPIDGHWSVSVGLEDGNEAEARIGGQFDGDINRFGVGSDHGPTGDWTRVDEDAPSEVPEGEWICLEWLNKGDTDEGRVWINDVEHPSLQTSATDHDGDDTQEYLLPEFDSAWFGWWHYQTGTNPPEFDVWIDEIVIDDERIGCVN